MQKYPILILHGWKLSGATFLPLVKELRKKNYIVYAPDMPGFGNEKELTSPYSLQEYVSFVDSYLKKKKAKKIIIIGHSFGGRVGIKFTALHASQVEKLILTGVPGLVPASKTKIKFFLMLSKIGTLIFLVPPFSLIADSARKILYKLAGASDYLHTSGAMRETFKKVIAEDLVKPMKSIGIPVYLLWGENDGAVPMGIARQMHKIIENSHFDYIAQARHMAPVTHAGIFAQKTDQFIQQTNK
jgi:pimeloyl-ACP methyl ester carboxylesterase